MLEAVLNTDGGSRGNPGLSGLGFDLVDKNGVTLAQGGWYLAKATNNVAEYSALIWGLENALAAGVTHVSVFADSELMVKQINGLYQVKSDDLKPLFMQAKSLFSRFDKAEIVHVYRTENKKADQLANEAMDAKEPIGSYLVAWQDSPMSLFDEDSALRDDRIMGDFQEDSEVVRYEPAVLKKEPAMEKNKVYEGPCKLSGSTYENVGGHYELTVKDHFDAAHTLPGYDGPCQYLHGHTWDIEVTIVGQHLDEVGVLYDFKDIKRDLHAVLENFDHRYINDTPPFDIINPTAENLARVVYYELEKTLTKGVVMQSVAVWESPQAKIVYRP